MKGIVFDIQRNALSDGPGIRTVVFLKGCPFNCVWCCNPESIRHKPEIAYKEQFCLNCGTCDGVCKEGFLKFTNGKPIIDYKNCIACGACVDACPHEALKIYGRRMGVDDVMNIVLKDKDYYDATGGGMTLSGGDPMFQSAFAIELLRKAKELGIHTAVETEGYYSGSVFSRVLPYVDYLYFDYKITDPVAHRKYTGAEIETVLQSLEYVGNYGVPMTIRCIIIPGINDNDTHFKAIADISYKYKSVEKIEIMPYHEYGMHKYYELGREPFTVDGGSVKREKAEEWRQRIISFGGENINIG